MADFSSVSTDLMIAAAQAGADGVADVLKRTFDHEFKITVGQEPEAFLGADALMTSGRCLVLQVEVEGGCAVAVLPAGAGLAPSWCGAPDENQKAKLGALAQELFLSLLPEDFAAVNQRFDFVDDVRTIDQIAFSDAANFVRFGVEGRAGKGDLLLLWPASEMADLPPGAVGEHELVTEAEEEALRDDQNRAAVTEDVQLPHDAETAASELAELLGDELGQETVNGAEPNTAAGQSALAYSSVGEGLRMLPAYARNLMKIPVNVSAVLAAKKMKVRDVHELSPGSIIEFNKSCEETLTLEVGDQLVAEGEAVRVGERFGIWVTQIALPDERFSCANRRREGDDS